MRRKQREEVSRHTKHNQREILESQMCGCLGCLSTIKPQDIAEWAGEAEPENPAVKVDRTAICPHCGEALIVGDRSGHEISATFLEAMRMR